MAQPAAYFVSERLGDYGVSHHAIYRIKAGHNWGWVT